MLPHIEMSEILPGLWLGDLGCTQDRDFLLENNITHMVSVIDTPVPIRTAVSRISLNIPLPDAELAPIHTYFTRAADFIDDALKRGGSVYCHCFAGISRSPTIVAAYLILKKGMTDAAALDFIRARRPIICPNDGFRRSLQILSASTRAATESAPANVPPTLSSSD